MLGIILTLIGAYTAYSLWGEHTFLSIIAIIATLFQASSLNEIHKEMKGLQPEDKVQTLINLLSAIIIIILLIVSFLI